MKNVITCIPLILFLLVACDSDDNDTETIDDDVAGTLINQESVNALLLQAFEIYSGRAYDDRLNRFPYEQGDNAHCDNEGVSMQDSAQLSYQNCAIAGDVVSGAVSQSIDNAGINRRFQDFTVTFGDAGRMTVDGGHLIACCTPVDEFSTDNLNYRLSYSAGRLQVDDATTFRRIEAQQGVMGGSFRMDPPAASGHVFEVSTSRDFSFDKGANLSADEIEQSRTHWLFHSGELEIRADDGSYAVVNADTGNDQTLSIVIVNALGESSVTESWAEFAEALRWSPGAQLGSFTRGNSAEIINEVFAYYTGHGYVDYLHSLPGYSDEQYVRGPDLTPTEYGGLVFGEPIDVNCSGGGTAAFTPVREEFFRYTGYGWFYDFEDCIDGDTTFLGTALVNAQELEFTYDSHGLSKETTAGSISFSGKVQYNPEGLNSCTTCKFWNADNLQLSVIDATNPAQVSHGNTQFTYKGPAYQVTSTLSGSLSINTAVTRGQWVHATIPQELKLDYVNDAAHEDESSHHFTLGRLELRSDNGDTLILEAENGDERTATISLDSPGLSTRFTQSWPLLRDNLLPVAETPPLFLY